MKKLLGFLAKTERKEENFYNFGDDSPPDAPEKNIYRYYRFDSDELDRGIAPRRRREKRCESSVAPAKMSNSAAFASSFTDSLEERLERDLPCVEDNLDSKSLDFSDSGSLVTVPDNFSPFDNESGKDNKFRKNTFVININNSKYFHIGSQKTINVNKNQTVQNHVARPFVDDRSAQFKTDFRKLLDCEEKLSEAHISLISLQVDDRWKELVKRLGLEERFLEVLELRNDHDRTLTVYDALQKHVTLFPNTSVGFLVNVLLEIQNVTLVEKLALELKPD